MVVGKEAGKDAKAETAEGPAVIYKEEIVEKFVDKIIEVIFFLPPSLSSLAGLHLVHSSRHLR